MRTSLGRKDLVKVLLKENQYHSKRPWNKKLKPNLGIKSIKTFEENGKLTQILYPKLSLNSAIKILRSITKL